MEIMRPCFLFGKGEGEGGGWIVLLVEDRVERSRVYAFFQLRETYHEPIQRDVWLRGIAGLGTLEGFLYLGLLVKLESLAGAIC